MTEISISPVDPADVGELLTLQRAAYVTEAQTYGDPMLPPLRETLGECAADLARGFALKATSGHRIVGAGRARIEGDVLHIGRLTVAPDMQGRGIGSKILIGLEALAPNTVKRFVLFTGHLSVGNIRLYERLGYREVRREIISERLTIVHLDKPARTE